jgi:hypothetical protein
MLEAVVVALALVEVQQEQVVQVEVAMVRQMQEQQHNLEQPIPVAGEAVQEHLLHLFLHKHLALADQA